MVTNSGAATSTSTASESVNIMEELDHKEANEILLRASAKVINKYSLVKSHSSKQYFGRTYFEYDPCHFNVHGIIIKQCSGESASKSGMV